MNDNGNPTTKSNENPVSTTTLQIVITWDQITGGLMIQGPQDNIVLFCGMLEAAKDAVLKRMAKIRENSSGIVGASAMPTLRM